jgi:hypothetical protein
LLTEDHLNISKADTPWIICHKVSFFIDSGKSSILEKAQETINLKKKGGHTNRQKTIILLHSQNMKEERYETQTTCSFSCWCSCDGPSTGRKHGTGAGRTFDRDLRPYVRSGR